jgi:prepilin-type processing-associated H-X9-DG protein
MALLRIKRPEHLKECDPAALGRLLGLDRAPEVKTLRRRLTRLAAHHCAEQLGAELARLRVDQRGHLMGFLYVDGHVRAYHGQRAISCQEV